jgi:citronellol/citronellal dehydrogenase
MNQPGQAQQPKRYGLSDAELLAHPTVYAPGLFKGKRVLISGGGSGIGKAIAILFARLGADIAICGRQRDKLDAAAALLRGVGVGVECFPLSIRDADAVAAMFDSLKTNGGIDVLVNNAGGQFSQPAIDFSVKGWNAVVDTNLNGTWYMMQQAARLWRDASRAGNIVNITATIDRGLPHMAHTTAARAGVIYASKTVAVEWAPLNIRVNCLGVGVVESSGFGNSNYSDAGRKTFYESNPMRRAGDVWDVAEAVVYLAGPSGKFITGEVLVIDGGQQMWGDFWSAGRPDYFKID